MGGLVIVAAGILVTRAVLEWFFPSDGVVTLESECDRDPRWHKPS